MAHYFQLWSDPGTLSLVRTLISMSFLDVGPNTRAYATILSAHVASLVKCEGN